MEFKTTISFSVCWVDERKEVTLTKIKALKTYILKTHSTYKFIAYQDSNVLSSLEELESIFDKFINYIDLNLNTNSNGENDINPGIFEASLIDLEDDGDVEYSSSFNISDEYIYIYLTTLDWYSSELEKLPNENIGISCEMNDWDGDYYYFNI